MSREESSKSSTMTIVAVVWFGWFTIMFNRMIIPPLLPLIEARYHATYAEAGLLVSGYMISYAVSQSISGRVVERFGEKKPIVIGIFLSSLFTALIVLVGSLYHMVVLRVLTGLLAGFFFVPSTLLMTTRIPVEERGRKMGIAMTGGSIATVLLYLLTGTFLGVLPDWSYIFLISASLGISFAAYVQKSLSEGRREQRLEEEFASSRENQSKLTAVLLSRGIFLVLLYATFTSLASWSLSTFLLSFLVSGRQLPFSTASFFLALSSFAAIAGPLLSGALKDRFGAKIPMLLSSLSAASVVVLIQFSPLGFPMVIIFAIWGLLSGAWWLATTVLVTELSPPKLRPRVLGIYNLTVFVGGFVGPLISGETIDVIGFRGFFALALILYLAAAFTATRF